MFTGEYSLRADVERRHGKVFNHAVDVSAAGSFQCDSSYNFEGMLKPISYKTL